MSLRRCVDLIHVTQAAVDAADELLDKATKPVLLAGDEALIDVF